MNTNFLLIHERSLRKVSRLFSLFLILVLVMTAQATPPSSSLSPSTSTSTSLPAKDTSSNPGTRGMSAEDRKLRPSRSRFDQLVNFFAGGIAGTVSASLTIPLEVVKTQLQSSVINKQKFIGSPIVHVCRQIWAKDQWRGFYKGLTPLLVGIIPTRAIYFWAYSTSKDVLIHDSPLGDGAATHLLSAFAAGITSNTIMNPLWMVRTRFQIMADQSVGQRNFKSYSDIVKTIWREEGPPGFFKGLSASYFGCFEGAIQWIAYEKIKSWLRQNRGQNAHVNKEPSPLELFCAAAASKFAAICITYPHEVVRTRLSITLREQAANGVFQYSGFLQTARKIAVEEGRNKEKSASHLHVEVYANKGLYSGLTMHLVRSVPNAAIMFMTYEMVGRFVKQRQQQQVQKQYEEKS